MNPIYVLVIHGPDDEPLEQLESERPIRPIAAGEPIETPQLSLLGGEFVVKRVEHVEWIEAEQTKHRISVYTRRA